MLRPLTSRHLKSIIDTLTPYSESAQVLDLFAGTGKFGIAMLIKGAKHVTFVETHFHTYKKLIEKLKNSINHTVYKMNAFDFLKRAHSRGKKFDIIFADPPYNLWDPFFTQKLFKAITQVINKGGIFLVKRPSKMVWIWKNSSYELWKTVVSGETTLNYYRLV